MGQFRHFIDSLFSFVFKVVIIAGLIIGGYFLWFGWGMKSKTKEERKEIEKLENRKLTAEEKASGFEGLQGLFSGIDEQLTDAQISSEQSTNINKKQSDEE